MLKTVITNKDDFANLPQQEWGNFFSLFHRLMFEKSLTLVEDIYKRYAQLSSFKFSFSGTEQDIKDLNFYIYDIDGTSLLLPMAVEELKKALYQMLLVPNVENIYKQFAVIKRTERFALYRIITKDLPGYEDVISAWEKNQTIDYKTEKMISFMGVQLPERVVSAEQVMTEDWSTNEMKFILLQLDFGLLRCQQFIWSVDLIFRENEGLESLLFEFDNEKGLQLSCKLADNVSNVKGSSFNRLNEVLDAMFMLFGGANKIEITRGNRFKVFNDLYHNAKDYRFSERLLESIEHLKSDQ